MHSCKQVEVESKTRNAGAFMRNHGLALDEATWLTNNETN